MSSAIPPAAPSKLFTPSNPLSYNQPVAGPSFPSSAVGGAAASTRRQTAQARNSQGLKNKHKSSKKARLVDEDAFAESNAMRAFNNRKGQTSITHLMNFALAPPSWHSHNGSSYDRPQRRYHTRGLGSGYHAADKARYVHANYRFIVSSDREYPAQAVDADVHVEWEAVLQVLGTAETQSTNCPICLSPPVAPRMAKCGHIFCLPCLIRYLHSAQDPAAPQPEKKARWQRCPICEDIIYISDTRPVRWFADQSSTSLQAGGDVLLRLLKRDPGTTLALPRDVADKYPNRPEPDIPWCHAAEVMEYARFIKGGAKYMTAQYDQEIAELEIQEKEDELLFGDVNTWTRKAVAAIEEAKRKLAHLPDAPEGDDSVPDGQSAACSRLSGQDEAADARPGKAGSMETRSVRNHSSDRAGPANSQSTLPRHPFYFYTALPNFLLSPLDIRILKTAFGDFSSFPSTILPRLEHISTGHVVDDQLRKRAKYMTHLPSGFEVNFLECDWTEIISPAILEHFQEEIWKRRKRNADKEAREERDRLRAEKLEEDKKWASIRRRRPSVNEKSFSETDFQPLVQPHSRESPKDAAIATTPPWANSRPHSSFAALGSPGTSPEGPRTVWGTAAVAPLSPRLMGAAEPDQAVDDGWLQGWEKDLLDEIDAVAMVEASLAGPGASQATAAAGQGGKKGKKKKITLMSTNARRGA
ncbi:hypothetical protein DV735_g2915, partial [Chaetothyriales sp. CBS 134920]